jgi:zinc transport system substrate-binding protein
MNAIMNDAETTNYWLQQFGRPMVRLLGVALAIAAGSVILGAATIAFFGEGDRASLAAESLGLADTSNQEGATRLECFAGIPPVAYLVERIGGPWVHVQVLVRPGQDPHTFFRIGIPFEDRLIEHLVENLVGRPARVTIIDTAAGIVRRAASDEDEGPVDPHVWLSPPNLKTMATNVARALTRADPSHERLYGENLKKFDDDIDAVHRRIAADLAPYRGQAFYVFHPAFAYFADAYGLRQESVEVEGKPPTPRQIFSLIHKARDEHVKIIFLQPQFNQQIAASIAQAIGGAVMPMDDLAFDVVANLDSVARNIAASKREKAK